MFGAGTNLCDLGIEDKIILFPDALVHELEQYILGYVVGPGPEYPLTFAQFLLHAWSKVISNSQLAPEQTLHIPIIPKILPVLLLSLNILN